jgi:hypothetical protein
MPKRIVDGDALWCSEKLLTVPDKYRVEYAWILPLANANGCFECSPLLVWRTCYSALRDDYTMKMVGDMLDAFEAAKMLFRWKDKAGKTFGFFIGSEKEGRLPKPSDRLKSAKQWQTGMLPVKELSKFLGHTSQLEEYRTRDLLATNSRPSRGDLADKSPTGNGIGSGVGNGSGDGFGDGKGSGVGEGIAYSNGHITTLPASSITSSFITSHNNNTSTPQHGNTSTPNTTTTLKPTFADEEEPEPEVPVDEGKLSTADDKFSNTSAKGFAMMFRMLMYDNPFATDTPKNWEDMWETDFKQLLARHSEIEVAGIIAVSQMKAGNKECYFRAKSLVDGMVSGKMLHTMVREKAKILPTLRLKLYKTLNRLENEGHRVF